MLKILKKLICFIGFHDLDDYDECEPINNVAIMKKCKRCGKIIAEC